MLLSHTLTVRGKRSSKFDGFLLSGLGGDKVTDGQADGRLDGGGGGRMDGGIHNITFFVFFFVKKAWG